MNEKTKIQLHHGDCLEVMKHIPDKSVDMVLTDPPYGMKLKPLKTSTVHLLALSLMKIILT